MEEAILNYLKDNFHTRIALFLGLLLYIFVIAALNAFLTEIIPAKGWRYFLYLCGAFAWISFWQYERSRLPRNKPHKVGIILCIRTENEKQKIRIKNDFVKRLNTLIVENNLQSMINVVLLNNHQGGLLSNILDNYSKEIDDIRKSGKVPRNPPSSVKKWIRAQNKIHGHFFVWGDVKERQDVENKYFLELEALVIHNPISEKAQKQLKSDFLNIWFKTISFQEKIEFRGFLVSADLVFIAVKYIVGIAALISRDINLALKLHSNLQNDFSKFKPMPPNLTEIYSKLISLIAEEHVLVARYHFSQGDIERSKASLQESMALSPNNYGGLLLQSIIEFNSGDPQGALKSVYKARHNAGWDGTWRYNEAFLLLYMEKFEQGLHVYRKIAKGGFRNEPLILKQVLQFNLDLTKVSPDKIQSYFILGFLKYKKESNYPEALAFFEKFLELGKNQPKFEFLAKRAEAYKKELEMKMKL